MPSGLFETNPVWRIRIDLAPEGVENLRNKAREYTRATIHLSDQVYPNVGLKLKGKGSFQPIDEKPSFTLDFSKFIPNQRLQGHSRIYLNNSIQDPTYLKEVVASELCHEVGIPAPRVAHALVELNHRRLGLYVVKEGFTREFLGRHFKRNDGNLYDDDQGFDVDQKMDRDLAEDSMDTQADLKRLAAAAREADLNLRWLRLNQALDMDRFLKFMSMELMIGHWDGYCLGQNNFRVYHDPTEDRIVFLPSGMDQVLSLPNMPWKPEMSGLVARAVMETPEGRELFATAFQSIFQKHFDSHRLTRRIDELVEALRPELDAGLFLNLHDEATALKERVVLRESSLRDQLSEPEPGIPVFIEDKAPITLWRASDLSDGSDMLEEQDPDVGAVLRIVSDTKTAASWRATIRLNAGHYHFRARAKVRNVRALPFGNTHGAGLRILGGEASSRNLLGSTDWESLRMEFEVKEKEAEVVLICQLRASAGEVLFEKGSLCLVRE